MSENDISRNYDELIDTVKKLHEKYPPVIIDFNILSDTPPVQSLTWDHLSKNLNGGFKRNEISLVVTTPCERKSNLFHYFSNKKREAK